MKRYRPFILRYFGVLAVLLGVVLLVWGPAWGASEASKVQFQKAYGKLPLHFIHNQGQMDERVKYYTQGGGYAFFFTREGVVLILEGARDKQDLNRAPGKEISRQRMPLLRRSPKVVMQLNPVGMWPAVKLAAANLRPGRVNYFIGNDPKRWQINIATYGAVIYREAYPGIDLKFYGNDRQLEYNVVVRPGADPAQVKFRYQGIKGLSIIGDGDLAIELPQGGSLLQTKPIVYQEIAGQRLVREGKFRLLDAPGRCTYGFEVGAYDPRYPLVIDPTLTATYLGGCSWDEGHGIAVTTSGVYVTGFTYSLQGAWPIAFPVRPDGSSPPTGATSLIFVTKINTDLTDLDYSTLVGGDQENYGYAIAVDDAGCAYVTGGTMSANFPTVNEVQQAFRGGYWDAVVFKLSEGGSLIYSTFLGGSDIDIGRGIAVINESNGQTAYVTGKTNSTDFPTKDAIQENNAGNGDAFVAKLSYSNSVLSLSYSTYWGGRDDDAGNGIAVDRWGNAYVAGATNSLKFPSTYKAGRTGNYDAFVAKFDNSGIPLYCVLLGGRKSDIGEAVAVDGSGNAYVTGYTLSTDFPGTGTMQGARVAVSQVADSSNKASATGKGGKSTSYSDAFVTKINPTGTDLVYSWRLGGSNYDFGYGIAVDDHDFAYVTGGTMSEDFPLVEPLYGKGGGRDVFVTKLDRDGTSALFSTYLPGSYNEEGFAIAVNSTGAAYVTGYTSSLDFATSGSFQKENNGYIDAFVAEIGPN